MSISSESSGLQAHPDAPGQAESRSALGRLKENDQAKTQPWWSEFEELLLRGWEWRKAALIAWDASPLKERWPPTQGELATLVLGLHGDRAIQKWRKNDPEIEKTVALMQAAPLLRHRRAIYDALVAVASSPVPQAHPDRRLALELLGDYTPRSKVQAEVEGEIGLMSVEEWREERARRQAQVKETMAAFDDAEVDGASEISD